MGKKPADSEYRSWRHVALALVDPSGRRQSSQPIINFVCDPYVQSLFTKPGSAFEPQGDRSPHHESFVKKTAAIQVTPTPNEKYDISIIKDDAIWLSKNARINEVAALRVVVIEFQSRLRNQLLGPISTQDVANIQEAAGATNAHAASVLPGLHFSGARDAADIQADFEKTESRRYRIFQTYLDERRFHAAAVDYTFTLMLQGSWPTSAPTDASRAIGPSFLQAFDMKIEKYHTLAWQSLNLIPDILQLLQSDLGGVVEDKSLLTDELQSQWIMSLLSETLHRMTVAFQLLDQSAHIFVSPPLVLLWFSLVAKLDFLERLGDVRITQC